MVLRPTVRSLPMGDVQPVNILRALRSFGWSVLLESGRGGRYSYVFGPALLRLEYDGTTTTLRSSEKTDVWEGDPWNHLGSFAEQFGVTRHPALKNFPGGVVGYLAYDMVRTLERLPDSTVDDVPLPLLRFDYSDRFVELDHTTGQLSIVALTDGEGEEPAWMNEVEAAIQDAEAARRIPSERPSVSDESLWRSNVSQTEFEAIVRRTREYIYEGDVFQANLSLRLDSDSPASTTDLYEALKRINPSPYMACLDYDDFGVASASPELLLKVRDGRVETRPIAGTRPRGSTEEEDQLLIEELVANEKERAEHLMLVDLERNDIGRVAEFGSVRVDEFMAVERYSHVNHIVSHVSGRLAAGRTAVDALMGMFPGGTITGAPKVRAMEIIEELEPTRRSLYTGSIGWIGFDGSCEFNIVIRTIVSVCGRAYVQAGAGIVADSNPASEYAESMRKAQAAVEAVSRANGYETPPNAITGLAGEAWQS